MQLKDTVFGQKYTLNCRGRLIDLSEPRLMGILNLTPDSFYDGSRLPLTGEKALLARAETMLTEGATFLDIGGYSTRPQAAEISAAEETERVLPAIRSLRRHFPEALLSVDTFRADVADAAADAGADLINDVSGGTLDDRMFETVARLQLPYICMHMRGTPATMQSLTQYDDLVTDIYRELVEKAVALNQLGVKDVILDPGFGFAKTIDQNFKLLRELQQLTLAGYPLLVGLSRKSMVYKTLGTTAAEALNGTTVLHAWALERGARILRVHDVQPALEAIQLWKRFETV